jgi:phage terminase large subunit-like protein
MTPTPSSTDAPLDAGARAVGFIERHLVHTKGKWAGVRFALEDWQRDGIVRPLFGAVRDDGLRQYRTAYVELPRKNGKSELAAAVALYLLLADGEQGAEIYGAAADKEQAAIVFEVAKRMVELNPVLARRVTAYRNRSLVVHKTASVYRVLSADAFTKHGLNAHGVVMDELHAQPNRELWDVLTTSTGTRTQPLVFAITTAGYDRNSICWELHDYAAKVANGVVEDPSFFGYVRGAPADADWRDERVWRAANPAIASGFRNVEEMRDLARRAESAPALQNTFRRLYLNQWTRQETRWLDIRAWDATAGLINESELLGRPCYAGLDLASTTDIAALVLAFPLEDGTVAVLPHFWVPRDTARERGLRDRVPYEAWAEQGLVHLTDGNVIDYGAIRATLADLGARFDIREVAYDRWGATQLAQQLQDDDGLTMVPIGQGFASLAGPTKELLTLVLSKRLRHGGHPVLRWMADNLVVRQDPAGNVKPDKGKSTERVDGIVALVMAIARVIANEHAPSALDQRGGLLVV